MALEIERKFLVDKHEWKKAKQYVAEREEIIQGYLSHSPLCSTRVRLYTPMTRDDNTSVQYAKITIKSKARGITRDEFEYNIPPYDGEQLIKMCDGLVKKTRHWLRVYKDGEVNDCNLWSVDVFKGINRGLILAEIELESEDEEFDIPDWVAREVTHDKRFSNRYLSKHKVVHK